ncbi:hypothetical protein K7X08_017850 [Anisodus acutangulus]|uniref:Germin-like protein n=1 Tax=Anisodus acutangulus TaxID=402998 RepID=A0A9Q1R8Z1_9SOLA|nr:hypothetical protein K7X08_017850 [Anisodus acutangulus]
MEDRNQDLTIAWSIFSTSLMILLLISLMGRPCDYFLDSIISISSLCLSIGNTSNAIGFQITSAIIHGFNALGIAIGRADFAPNGFSPPHTHPRASEIVLVLEGCVEIGFVTSHPENRLFTKTFEVGYFFTVPQGLVHFQSNVGEANAATITPFSSQFPGLIRVADPKIPDDLLAKDFRIDERREARYKGFLVEHEGGLGVVRFSDLVVTHSFFFF